MAGPVVLRPETDVVNIILARFGGGLVPPDLRRQPSQRFDPHRGRTPALVFYRRLDGEAGLAQMILIALPGDVVGGDAVRIAC
jgi:hypothetical protein